MSPISNPTLAPPAATFEHHPRFAMLFRADEKDFQDMGWNDVLNEPRDLHKTSALAPRVKTHPPLRWRHSVHFACGCLCLIVTFMGTVHWSMVNRARIDYAAILSADDLRPSKLLAVVTPTHAGDLEQAVAALSSWSNDCSAITRNRMHLVIYFSGRESDGVLSEEVLSTVAQTGGRCFGRTRAVFAELDREDDVYPKGPSIMFYNMFLDHDVVEAFKAYDALAIIEWDVVVAHPTSFERLYKAAFVSSEKFWVKGSTLAGAEFHGTASVSDMRHVLGHLNGNAIYNNTDPAFHEFVGYTLRRWQYSYPYDVALWATISDFPYSWPLWQRYSSKFVATQLIANVGFHDVSQAALGMAIASDTLFIHGSSGGGGSINNNAFVRASGEGPSLTSDCTSACGSAEPHDGIPGMSTFCDMSCLPGWSSAGPRFSGYGCGANDPSRFGEACRQCYTSEDAALAEDQRLSSLENMGSNPGMHVVMCSTGNPPMASECSDECKATADAVCDYRCGSGVYGDFNCNWRGFGRTCRFCFQDVLAAFLADGTAKASGGRVILCQTHEPPLKIWSNVDQDDEDPSESQPTLPSGAITKAPDVDSAAEAAAPYSENINRGEICAFLLGYFEFLPETRVSVSSVVHFMPGMRIGIATDPKDFHVFNRTLGHLETVNIVNSSNVENAALHADEACGVGTKLIFYMEIGEILSRPFTSKDTHSPRGDLIVAFSDQEKSHPQCKRRAKVTSMLLGFSPPCFTDGSDLILPAELNAQLRAVLRRSKGINNGISLKIQRNDDLDGDLNGVLASKVGIHGRHGRLYIPEVLAALAFSRNHDSMAFINPTRWTVENLFVTTSIWDIPLIKPRFGCTYDMLLSHVGYDLSERITKEFESFKLGLGKCELGFREVHPFELNIKASREFGVDGALQDIPDIKDFRVSVMYRTFAGDAKLFEMSIQTVLDHFPHAYEVVVVVIEQDEPLFEDIMDGFRGSAPFPLRLIVEPELMNGHIQQKYSKLRADLYTEGDYVLHLDSDVVILEDITYSHVFHHRKPVLPFRRYREEVPEGLTTIMCWQNGTSFAIGEEVLHEFSIFNTHVYPRSMYAAARQFIEEHHQQSFVDFMSTRRGSCMHPKTMAKWTVEERDLMFSDFNYMGAYLWYHMHDAVYWLAADPLDTQLGQWRPDLAMFAWVCQANGRHAPEDEAGFDQYIADFRMVQNHKQCLLVRNHWKSPKMKDPSTRTKIDTGSKEWMSA